MAGRGIAFNDRSFTTGFWSRCNTHSLSPLAFQWVYITSSEVLANASVHMHRDDLSCSNQAACFLLSILQLLVLLCVWLFDCFYFFFSHPVQWIPSGISCLSLSLPVHLFLSSISLHTLIENSKRDSGNKSQSKKTFFTRSLFSSQTSQSLLTLESKTLSYTDIIY